MYELQSQSDSYQFLRTDTVRDMDIVHRLDGTPVNHQWDVPKVTLFREAERFQGTMPSDFPYLTAGVPVFSANAVKALGDVLNWHGEVLPLFCEDCEGIEYFAFNVTTLVDALDLERSEVKYFRDGVRIMDVKKYGFLPQRLAGVCVFKLPELKRSHVFVTDDFVQQVADHRLTGFCFKPVWSDH